MEVNIIELATQCPDLTTSVKASDLLTFGRTIKEELLESLQDTLQGNTPQQPEELLTREDTMKKFGISSATIWRWKKCGYLVPIKVGSMDRYRLTDINALLEKKGGIL